MSIYIFQPQVLHGKRGSNWALGMMFSGSIFFANPGEAAITSNNQFPAEPE
jgi:hypothetical protein